MLVISKKDTFQITAEGLAETQVLLNALEAYKVKYFADNYGKPTYNENHQQLIEEMYNKAIEEYIKDKKK